MKPVTVTQLNEYIGKKLREDYRLRNLPVEGEISGLSRSGQHYYFTLKDQGSMIKCAIWGSNASKIDMSLVENGRKIVAIGDISPYTKGGNYSFSVRMIESIGQGDLSLEFNRVKEMLEKEGLFDRRFKKPIPDFPYRIGVITASNGAAVQDIRKIITAKNRYTSIVIFPTQVQGEGSARSIINNIELANYLAKTGMIIDTLIVGRGGGSPEDLMSFNDEGVARAIFASEIPIISAVGHETDFAISDFVADVRAETPTAAADMAVMNTDELYEEIENNQKRLTDSIGYKLESERNMLKSITALLHSNMTNKTQQARNNIEKALISLRENDPRNIFAKGYSAVLDDDERIISSLDKISIGSTYRIRMKDGSFAAEAISKERE